MKSMESQIVNNLRLYLIVIFLFLISSCGQKINDYSGVYESVDKSCEMKIIITKENGEYQYEINSKNKDQSGLLKVNETDNEIYFKFVGLFGVNPREEISGKFMNETIIIQNYGNSMNQYLRFSECDIKYIELKKIEID